MEKLQEKSNATVPPFQSNHKRATCLWQKQITVLKSIKIIPERLFRLISTVEKSRKLRQDKTLSLLHLTIVT